MKVTNPLHKPARKFHSLDQLLNAHQEVAPEPGPPKDLWMSAARYRDSVIRQSAIAHMRGVLNHLAGS